MDVVLDGRQLMPQEDGTVRPLSTLALLRELAGFSDALRVAQRPLPAEAAQVLADHRWELYGDS